MIRRILMFVAVAFVLVLLYLTTWPVTLTPVAWTPAANPHGQPPFTKNRRLTGTTLIETGEGPESIAVDASGQLVTGLLDGRIVRYGFDGQKEPIADTQGRPLGLEFDASNRLVIADANKGLLRLDSDGSLKVLVDAYEDVPFKFADDLAIDSSGAIWFSDASMKFGFDETLKAALESRPTGRLFKYDPATETTELMLGELSFANGVALSSDESFVVVCETHRHRIRRLWLKGPKAGTDDLLIENLPGYPDNVTEAPGGGFWVALFAPRDPLLDQLSPYPFARKMVWRLMMLGVSPANFHYGWAVKLDEAGRVTASWEDPTGRAYTTTSVIQHGDRLIIGSLHSSAIAYLDGVP